MSLRTDGQAATTSRLMSTRSADLTLVTGFWVSGGVFAGVAAAAAVLLIFRGAIRNVGTGVLIACGSPVWVFVPLLLAVLSFPILATILVALVSTAVERRRRGH